MTARQSCAVLQPACATMRRSDAPVFCQSSQYTHDQVMEVHHSALVEYSASDMFDLIENAEHYPEFLPWCAGATILARDDFLVAARIAVAWHGIRFEITT